MTRRGRIVRTFLITLLAVLFTFSMYGLGKWLLLRLLWTAKLGLYRGWFQALTRPLLPLLGLLYLLVLKDRFARSRLFTSFPVVATVYSMALAVGFVRLGLFRDTIVMLVGNVLCLYVLEWWYVENRSPLLHRAVMLPVMLLLCNRVMELPVFFYTIGMREGFLDLATAFVTATFLILATESTWRIERKVMFMIGLAILVWQYAHIFMMLHLHVYPLGHYPTIRFVQALAVRLSVPLIVASTGYYGGGLVSRFTSSQV